jgi:hypothetical protein
VTYDPNAANYDAEVQQMVDRNPDGVLVIGFEESRASAANAGPFRTPIPLEASTGT